MFSAQTPVSVAEWGNHCREWLNLNSTMSCPEQQQWAGTERSPEKTKVEANEQLAKTRNGRE